MSTSFFPRRLSGTALALEVDPFEVVRLAVASGSPLSSHSFTDADIAALKDFAGIQFWLADGGLKDDNAARGLLRAGLKAMIDGGYVGSSTSRLDNLWRGVSSEHRALIEGAVALLIQAGLLLTVASPRGVQVSIADAATKELGAFASDGKVPASLNGVF